MTRLTHAQLKDLSLEEAIAGIRSELDAYGQDGNVDHLYNASSFASWAGNRAPKPPRVPYRRRAPTTPTGTPIGSIHSTATGEPR